MAQLKSNFEPFEGETVVIELAFDDIAVTCKEKLKKCFTCKKGTWYLIVTNKRVVIIDASKQCCSSERRETTVNYISEYGYVTSKGCCPCSKGGYFYFLTGKDKYTIGLGQAKKEDIEQVTTAFHSLVGNL